MIGLEPITCWLQISCSANWATSAYDLWLLTQRIAVLKMTPTGFEPVLPPWKGDVLTAWPWSRVLSPLGVSNVSDKKTPRVGLEPTTTRLTAECSTIELSRKISCFISDLRECSAFSKSYKAKCEEIIYSFKTEHWNLISYILTSILLSYPKPLVKPSTD